MMRLVKSISFLCVLLLTIGLFGCSSNHNTSNETKKTVSTTETVKSSDSAVETKKDPPREAEQVDKTSDKEKPTIENTNKNQSSTTTNNQVNKNNTTAVTQPAATGSITQTKPSSPPKSSTPPKPSTNPQPSNPAAQVTFSILGPKDRGMILAESKQSFKNGDTVFDVLKEVAKKHNIVIDSRGSGATAYIEGIDNIYEFDYGAKSGWIFKVNGVSLAKSIGTINVKDGDRIECFYTE